MRDFSAVYLLIGSPSDMRPGGVRSRVSKSQTVVALAFLEQERALMQ